jgi:hypothetical protein
VAVAAHTRGIERDVRVRRVHHAANARAELLACPRLLLHRAERIASFALAAISSPVPLRARTTPD